MVTGSAEQQLELFTLEGSTTPPPRRQIAGRWLVQLRYDQVMLTAIGCVLGVTVIFACGVERGKQLARSESALLVYERPQLTAVPVSPMATKPDTVTRGQGIPATTVPRVTPRAEPVVSSKPTLASTRRYAIQVVTYSRPQLASRELQRLQAHGERAFLMKRQGRMAVYVGPFSTPAHASEKLTTLKARYQDCFVRTL